ncbi:MAG: S-layer homology domain-containing protein [Synergistaceae bacterium]|nr:S-layer homology domain-containing protein [Synergistaceae bacterium]
MKKRILPLSLVFLFALTIVPYGTFAADVKNLELVNQIDSEWSVSTVVASPQSDMLLIQESYTWNVYLYNLNSNVKKELLNTLSVGVGSKGMCFSLDGSLCAVSVNETPTGDTTALIAIFDTKSGEMINEISLGTFNVTIAFDRGNNLIAYDTVEGVFGFGSKSGISVRNARTGDVLVKTESDNVKTLCQNPANDYFVASMFSGLLKIYDGKTGGSAKTLELAAGANSMAFSPDGKYLAVSAGDKTTIFDAENNHSKIREFDKGGYVSFDHDGSILSLGDTVYFAAGGFTDYATLQDGDNYINADSALLTRDGKYFITYGGGKGVRLLDASKILVRLTEVRLTPDVIELLSGEEMELKLMGVYSDGSVRELNPQDAKFSISDFSIAKMNENSKIQGVTVGKTELTVSYYGTDIKKAVAVVSSRTDESAAAWAREGIDSAVDKGFVPPDIQNNYTSVITRQEFCRMAVKFVEYMSGEGIDAVLADNGVSRDPSAFSDTSDSDILAAYALGITNGTGGGQFSPNGQFTREQAATMLMNTCKAIGMDVDSPPVSDFTDLGSASPWAVDGINFVRTPKCQA